MKRDEFCWYLYVLDTVKDDLIRTIDFVGTFDDLYSKLNDLYHVYDGFSHINIKIIMK